MEGIRIEGISPNVGKITLVVDSKHIMTVLTAYENVLPCLAFKSLEQYYVMFYPDLNLPPIITVRELSPKIRQWIDEQIAGRFEDGYGNEYNIPD